ncbi:MAG: PH domain-containing protein [archaeon GB-1867-005]|nr:PH domain-containing protein [Candidatus Culexmicrobium cathedralense]
MPIELKEGEQLVEEIKPHPLAFIDLYLIFIYLLAISVAFHIYGDEIARAAASMPIIGLLVQVEEYLTLTSWALCIVIPFLAVSILKVRWRWLFFSLIIVALGVAMKFKLNLPEYTSTALFGIAGLSLINAYRKGHTYYITNQRIVTELKFIKHKQREISYSRLTDIIVAKGVIGRIFNVGTIIPITPSGMGLGEDFALAGVGMPGKAAAGVTIGVAGGKAVKVPRGRSPYVLFGVKNPLRIKELISKYAWEREESTILRKISEDIEKLVEKVDKESGSVDENA